MTRFPVAVCVAALLAVPAAAAPPAGSWKMAIALGERQQVTLLFAFSEAEGKWVGDFIDSRPPLRTEPKVTAVAVAGEQVQFTLTMAGKEFLTFEGISASRVSGAVYDRDDMFFAPFGGIENAERPGPNVGIFERRRSR